MEPSASEIRAAGEALVNECASCACLHVEFRPVPAGQEWGGGMFEEWVCPACGTKFTRLGPQRAEVDRWMKRCEQALARLAALEAALRPFAEDEGYSGGRWRMAREALGLPLRPGDRVGSRS